MTLHYAFTISALAALLAGCSGSQLPIGAPRAMPQSRALAARANSTNYKVLHSFSASPGDGAYPTASLIEVNGTLYAPTAYGGSFYCLGYRDYSCGTVFSVTPGGTEKVVHSFGNGPDGNVPASPLIEVRGKLYGTTSGGGAQSRGTVFSITTSGTEKVLYSFGSGTEIDGGDPAASLIEVKGTLYGTTQQGGAFDSTGFNGGTVFSVTFSGTEKVLHSFGRGSDGAWASASLIEVNGMLYGTTEYGGAYSHGTVFSITPSGREKVLHSFGKGTDGAYPTASLIEVNNTLYGTTQNGGRYNNGTVFSIMLGGKEKVLHSFGNQPDGAHPAASLIEFKGKLYGTTYIGGSSPDCGSGCGTIFSITTRGTEKVLYGFGFNGFDPVAGLIAVNGTLYGTTSDGGTYDWGTVFALRL